MDQLKEVIDGFDFKTMGDQFCTGLNEKMLLKAKNSLIDEAELEIPKNIPLNKFVLFSEMNILVATGDTVNEISTIAAELGINPPFNIKYNGQNPPKQIHYVYLSFAE
jgi:hypothetical protein